MLYNNFIVCIMTVAFFAMIDMAVTGQWTYIILPIGIFIWGIFKFFLAPDSVYNRSKIPWTLKYNNLNGRIHQD